MIVDPINLINGIRKKYEDAKTKIGQGVDYMNEVARQATDSPSAGFDPAGGQVLDSILTKALGAVGMDPNDIEGSKMALGILGAHSIPGPASPASISSHPMGWTLNSKYPEVNARNLNMLSKKAVNSAVEWLRPYDPWATEAYSRTPEMRAGLTAEVQSSKYPLLFGKTPQVVESIHPKYPDYLGSRKTDPISGQSVARVYARGGRAGKNEARDFGLYGETWPHEVMHGASAQGNMQGVLNRTVPPGNLPIAGQYGGKPERGDYITPYLSKKEYDNGINLFNNFHREGKSPVAVKDLKGKELKDYKKFQADRADAQLKAYRGQWEEVRAGMAQGTGFASFNKIMMQPWNESVKNLPTIDINARAIPGNQHYELVKKYNLIDPHTLHQLETRPESAPPIKLSDIFSLEDLVMDIRDDNLPIRGVRGSHPEAPDHTFTPIRHPLESFWKEVSKELVKRGITKNLPYHGPLD